MGHFASRIVVTAAFASLAPLFFASAAFGDECPAPVPDAVMMSTASVPFLSPREFLDQGRSALVAGRARQAAAFLTRAIAGNAHETEPLLSASASALLSLAYARMGERELSMAAADAALAARDLPPEAIYDVQASLAPVFARYRGRQVARDTVANAVAAAQTPLQRGLALGNLARLEKDVPAARLAASQAVELLAVPGADRQGLAAHLAALEVLEDQGSGAGSGFLETRLESAYAQADRIQDAALAADALGLLARARARAGKGPNALLAADRAVALAGAADSARLHDWLWQRARLKAQAGRPAEAADDYAAATERLARVRGDVETELADFGITFREGYGALYLEYADLLLRRAESEGDAAARQALLVKARDAVETAKVAEVAAYFRDPCIARDALSARLEVVDRGSAVLYYVMLADRVIVLVSHRGGMDQVRLPVEAAQVERMVDEFRRLVEKRSTRQYLRPAKVLYDALLKPLETTLAAIEPHTLVVVPDGVLRTIPFAALHDGTRFLAQRYAVAVAPSLSLTDPRPLAAIKPEALILGLTVARQGFPSLPSVGDEVATLRTMLTARVVMNESFLTNRVLDEVERSPAGIVHVATHGHFSSNTEDTFLLAYDGKLGIDALRRAIAAGRTRPEPIEILTLSACETAAGDDRAALGLAGVALRAGARSALASLWFVNDESTAMLVTEFYRNAVAKRMPRAQALRRAQLAMLADDRFNHPAYWGAFLLIGSWL